MSQEDKEKIDLSRMVRFKSVPSMYEKEKSGKKPNTVRRIDDDVRFDGLRSGVVTHIQIINSHSFEYFIREITDYTEWDEHAIISWRAN